MAWRDVLGVPGQRSREQQLAWAWIVHFCRLHKSAFDADPRVTAFRLGRQEVAIAIAEAFRDSEPTVGDLLTELFPPDIEDPP
jgi:hypothetical protein